MKRNVLAIKSKVVYRLIALLIGGALGAAIGTFIEIFGFRTAIMCNSLIGLPIGAFIGFFSTFIVKQRQKIM